MPTSVQEKRQPFSKGIIRFFLEYCCYLGIQVFRLLFARGLRIPPYFAMLRLHMALCHASCSRQASNLSIPKERGKNGMPVMGEECEGIVFFRPTIPRNGVPLPCPANE